MTSSIQIISILGGPGAGKGTQCSLLTRKYLGQHLSVGDLLRAETNQPGSPFRDIILENMRLGRVGPKELTVGILRSRIEELSATGSKLFILDGFPRNMDQNSFFESQVQRIDLVIVLECPKALLIERLSSRGRFDDTSATIEGRLATFEGSTSTTISAYEELGKVIRVPGDLSIAEVSTRILEAARKSGIILTPRT